MGSDPHGARAEMKSIIAAQLRTIHGLSAADADNQAQTVVLLFSGFEERWRDTETTTMGYNGRTWLETRYLVASMPVQTISYERPTVRYVDGA